MISHEWREGPDGTGLYRISERTFQSKKTRDRIARECKACGMQVKRRSVRNQILHPQYVEDFVGSDPDHRKHFAILYTLETVGVV